MPSQTYSEESVLALKSEALKSAVSALKLYETALQAEPANWRRALKGLWTAAGLAALIVLAWAEPWSARILSVLRAQGLWPALIDYALSPLVMALRAVLLVESFGYAYHRYFQHIGWLTRRAQVFRRNQKYHWMHHMILYPIGRFYKRAAPYVSSEQGISWSWVVPAIIALSLALATMGPHWGTLVFMVSIAAYAKYVVDEVHSRFHLAEHSWQERGYFQWLEKIHLLHHWDQNTNFTIVHPFMDVLFGTYLSPRGRERQIKVALEDLELTVSDLTNWRYLLLEATPAEYAFFISEAKRHPRSLRKIGHLMEVLRHRLERFPADAQARELRQRAADLLNLVHSAR